jgi:carotenoid cleavage dioxygenase-like enzyme
MTAPRGWFLFDGVARLDLEGGAIDHYQFPAQVFASEAPMVPRPGATREDDGWVVTFVADSRPTPASARSSPPIA